MTYCVLCAATALKGKWNRWYDFIRHSSRGPSSRTVCHAVIDLMHILDDTLQ
jgi:hypothetical protein